MQPHRRRGVIETRSARLKGPTLADTASTQGHPYIPNSSPQTQAEMLAAIGISSVNELYEAVPERLRLTKPLQLPGPIESEYELTRHVKGLLARNQTCEHTLSFLGGGCWQHHVPAVCDEVNRRAEFVTSYGGEVYSDHGKYQAFFEYASLLGELCHLDVVALSTYDWACAASAALLWRHADRTTLGSSSSYDRA